MVFKNFGGFLKNRKNASMRNCHEILCNHSYNIEKGLERTYGRLVFDFDVKEKKVTQTIQLKDAWQGIVFQGANLYVSGGFQNCVYTFRLDQGTLVAGDTIKLVEGKGENGGAAAALYTGSAVNVVAVPPLTSRHPARRAWCTFPPVFRPGSTPRGLRRARTCRACERGGSARSALPGR